MLPALVENMSLMLEFHLRIGKELSECARYFIRAIARQDLLISLSRLRRTKIDSTIWLDDYSRTHTDRLMGKTTTLIPILSELCALAEDVRTVVDSYSITDGADDDRESEGFINPPINLLERRACIEAKLVAWHPIHDHRMSMQTSRKFLLHAYAWKAAALLYLFRLFNRAGSCLEADSIALGMAYEVIVHISGPPDEIKMSLWPLFIASCELERQDDRERAVQLFDDICRARPTVTAKRTKFVCVSQVWSARDRGADWDWMQLTRHDENDFVPI